jgi:hypothetical protein
LGKVRELSPDELILLANFLQESESNQVFEQKLRVRFQPGFPTKVLNVLIETHFLQNKWEMGFYLVMILLR